MGAQLIGIPDTLHDILWMRAVTDIINILCLQQNLIIQGTIAAIAKCKDRAVTCQLLYSPLCLNHDFMLADFLQLCL